MIETGEVRKLFTGPPEVVAPLIHQARVLLGSVKNGMAFNRLLQGERQVRVPVNQRLLAYSDSPGRTIEVRAEGIAVIAAGSRFGQDWIAIDATAVTITTAPVQPRKNPIYQPRMVVRITHRDGSPHNYASVSTIIWEPFARSGGLYRYYNYFPANPAPGLLTFHVVGNANNGDFGFNYTHDTYLYGGSHLQYDLADQINWGVWFAAGDLFLGDTLPEEVREVLMSVLDPFPGPNDYIDSTLGTFAPLTRLPEPNEYHLGSIFALEPKNTLMPGVVLPGLYAISTRLHSVDDDQKPFKASLEIELGEPPSEKFVFPFEIATHDFEVRHTGGVGIISDSHPAATDPSWWQGVLLVNVEKGAMFYFDDTNPYYATGTYETPNETAPDLAGAAAYFHSGSELNPLNL